MILFGAAYYPEHRDSRKWGFDLDQMAAAGVNALRVGEFAWKRFEPSRDRYDFEWMDAFGRQAAERQIGLLMCPPLRTAPIWLVEQDPSMLILDEQGRRLEFGSRYTFCINHPLLIEQGMKLAGQMARHFESEPWVLGWHLDNEFGDEPDCHCRICTERWQSWLEQRYGTMDKLNAAWGNVFWGLEYDEFRQVPTPRLTKTAHQPAQIQNWRKFRSDCTVEVVGQHARALRDNGVKRLITTNNQVWNPRTDYFEMARHLDVCGTNYYPPYGASYRAIEMGLAAVRCYKGKGHGFHVHELRSGAHTISGAAGNTPAPGEIGRLTMHTVAHGADAIFYFRWRNCPFGCEQHHGALTDYDGRPTRIYHEAAEIGKRLRRLGPELEGTRIESQVAVLFDFPTRWMTETGVHWNGPTGLYMQRCRQVYAELRAEGINVDLTGRELDFNRYAMLVTPMLAGMSDALAHKLCDYVRQGGTLVWHPLSGMRDEDAACYPDRIHPELKALFGVTINDFVTLPEATPAMLDGDAGGDGGVSGLIDLLTLEPDTRTLARLAEGPWYGGGPAITERTQGKGRAVYVAGSLNGAGAAWLWDRMLPAAGVERLLGQRPPACIEVTERVGEDGRRFRFLINATDQEQVVPRPDPAAVRDCWNEATIEGKTITLPPFGGVCLELGA